MTPSFSNLIPTFYIFLYSSFHYLCILPFFLYLSFFFIYLYPSFLLCILHFSLYLSFFSFIFISFFSPFCPLELILHFPLYLSYLSSNYNFLLSLFLYLSFFRLFINPNFHLFMHPFPFSK